MYESYFGINEKPFSIAPDPRFVYLSAAHEEALAHLAYGVMEPGGFVMLTGEVGTGKTTLIRMLLQQLPENVDLALVFNPALSPFEFVAAVCDEFQVPVPPGHFSIKSLVDALNRKLLESFAAGRRTVLIIDEAQGLSPEVLEQVRLLTNLETTREKLLEIILVGQPELRYTLAQPGLRQLSQRITARFHLKPLSRRDVKAYVQHRLSVVGADGRLFTEPAKYLLARVSGGIPRLINEVADRAMLGAFATEKRQVNRRMVARAAHEVFGDPLSKPRSWVLPAAASLLVVVGIGLMLVPSHVMKPAMDAIRSAAQPKPQRPILVTIEAPPEPAEPGPARGASEELAPVSILGNLEEPEVDESPLALLQGGTSDSAWQLLFGSWGASFDPYGGDPCQQAAAQRLQCVAGDGGWDELAALGRPAVLRLDTTDGTFFATLTHLEGDRAVLEGDAGDFSLRTKDVDPYWAGDFVLLWRPPDVHEGNDGETLRAGEMGLDVLWLRERLAQAGVQDIAPESDPAMFDRSLEQAVRNFQQANGLVPDGEVDGQTRLRLNLAVPAYNEPLLSGVR